MVIRVKSHIFVGMNKYPTLSELVQAYNENRLKGEGPFLWSNKNWTKDIAQGFTSLQEIKAMSEFNKKLNEDIANVFWPKPNTSEDNYTHG